MVAAGFEGYVGRGPGQITGGLQGMHLGMRATGLFVPALADKCCHRGQARSRRADCGSPSKGRTPPVAAPAP